MSEFLSLLLIISELLLVALIVVGCLYLLDRTEDWFNRFYGWFNVKK